LHDFARSRNFSADVFLIVSWFIISALLPPSHQTILLDSKIVETPIVIAILGTFAIPLKSDEASTRVIWSKVIIGFRIDMRPWLIKSNVSGTSYPSNWKSSLLNFFILIS
jgi:hypothetical protein